MVQLEQIAKFDLSKKQSSIIFLVVLVGYLGISSFELFEPECSGFRNCFDYDRRMARLHVWDISWYKDDARHFVHLGLLSLSNDIFGNYKALTLVSSVLLLFVTYILAISLTKKNIGGLIAVAVTLQSSIFYNYDVSVTYPSFWGLLFLSSLYFTRTKLWGLSPILYSISIPAKALTALFLPGFLVFLLLSDTLNKKKILLTFLIFSAVGLTLIFTLDDFSDKLGGFLLFNKLDFDKFIEGFISWVWKGFASDQLSIVFLVFSTTILLRIKINNGKALIAFVYCLIFTSPILIGMTTYDVWPYRMLPIVSVISLMMALTFCNLDKWISMFLNSRSLKEQV